MSLTFTPAQLLRNELTKLYMGKTILSATSVPFTVGSILVDDDEGNTQIWFRDAPPPQATRHRVVWLDEALPEIWPVEVPLSPCS